MGSAEHAAYQIPSRQHHQAIHICRHPTSRGARQTHHRRFHLQVSRAVPGAVAAGHHPSLAHPHFRHPQLHRPAQLHAHQRTRAHQGRNGRALSRPAARIRPRRTLQVQQLRLLPARHHHRKNQRAGLRRVPSRQHLRPARNERFRLRRHRHGAPAPRRRLHAPRQRHPQLRLYRHGPALFRRLALFHRG